LITSPRDIKYDPHLDPERVGAIGVARYAVEFFAAGEAADDAIGSEYLDVAPTSVTFLMGRSLELALKAFLIHKEIPLDFLKRDVGHNLERALTRAESAGLSSIVTLTDQDRSIIIMLNASYSKKDLEYFIRGAATYPLYRPLQSVCKRVLEAIINEIPDARILLRSRAGRIFESVQT
jgi:hypothetical protein